MADTGFINVANHELQRSKRQADRAIEQLPADRFFAAPDERIDNSVAIIVKHIAGNMHSRWRDWLTTDGEKPDRDRDREFVIEVGDTRDVLLQRWEAGWKLCFAALEPLGDADLDRTVTIRGEPFSVMQAIARQVSHVAYHSGQIVYLARHLTGPTWRSLSVPKGESAAFNRNPTSYRSPESRG